MNDESEMMVAVDNGSNMCKVGSAGDEALRAMFTATVGRPGTPDITEQVTGLKIMDRTDYVPFVNKVHRCILKWQMGSDDAYDRFRIVTESVKVIIATYNDAFMDDVQSMTVKDTVDFGSDLHGIDYVDREKPKLTDSLICNAGIISDRQIGDARFNDSRANEQERNAIIKTTGILLFFGLQDRMVPNLFVNKVELCILEWQMGPEDVYGRLRGVIESVKVITATYNDALVDDVQSVTQEDTVDFGNDLNGWRFNAKLQVVNCSTCRVFRLLFRVTDLEGTGTLA